MNKTMIKNPTVKTLVPGKKNKKQEMLLIKPPVTRFVYVRPKDSVYGQKQQPTGCMSYRATPLIKDNEVVGFEIQYGLSYHNPVDTFDRAMGRKIAEGRMNSVHKTQTLGGWVQGADRTHLCSGYFSSTETTLNRALSNLFDFLGNNKNIPKRSRKNMQYMATYFWRVREDTVQESSKKPLLEGYFSN